MVRPQAETDTAPLVITLFGPMQVSVRGNPLPHLRSRKALWLLALLTLRRDRPVEREWLTGTLWPDVDQDRAYRNLRVVLSELRRALGDEGERLQSPGYHTLRLDLSGTQVDVATFDAAIARRDLPALETAVALYRGPLLEGCSEEWVPQERRVREEDCLLALQTLADAALTVGDHATAAGYCRRAVGLDPWREAAQRGLMEALSQSRDSNAAMKVYQDFVRRLRQEDPRAVPDELTTALYTRLRQEARRQTHAPAPPAATGGAGADVGLPTVTGNLPHLLTDLVGREDERLEVAARLRRSRLVTLTGPGGIGKTRMAIELAAEVASEFRDGVWLVALEALTDATRVAGQIAAVLGLKETESRSTLQTLADHLRQKRLLLVLDNCEHLRESSAQIAGHLLQECAQVRILATSREALRITGEAAWRVPTLSTPDPADLPSHTATMRRVLLGYESVQLFMQRACAVQRDFSLVESNALAVAQICCDLDGIPLAIELAAARVNVMTPEQIATRLHDHLDLLTGGSRTAFPRQQTLRAALDWSYDLLSVPAQRLLGRLSVFAGGWTLEAVEQICAGDGIGASEILDLLSSLVDKSLVLFEVQKAGGRYRLLETVRQYSAERLQASGEAAWIRARHRNHFLVLAEEAEPQLIGADQGVWLVRLEAEHANLRTALDWCRAERNGATAGLRLAGALGRFWEMHGYYREGRASLSEALGWEGDGGDGDGGQTLWRAKALNVAGVLAFYQGDYREARMLLEEGLVIQRRSGDRTGIASTLNDLGDVVSAQDDPDEAYMLYAESLAIFRELGNPQGIASLLHHMGRHAREQGDYEEAKRLYEEGLAIQRMLGNRQDAAWALHHLGNLAGMQGDTVLAWSFQEEGLAIFRELGNRQGAAWALHELGKVAVAQADHEEAQAFYTESLAIFRELGNRQGVALLLQALGRHVHEQDDYEEAKRLYEEGLAIFRELGNRLRIASSLNDLARLAADQGRFAPAWALYAEGLNIDRELGDRRGVAVGLRGLASGLAARDNVRKAACLWGAAEALCETGGEPLLPGEIEIYGRQVAQARAALGEDFFVAAWKEGRALGWEQAATYALED